MRAHKLLITLGLLGAGLSGCMRFDVLPKTEAEATKPFSKPRTTDSQDIRTQKSATQIYKVGPRDILKVEVPKDPTITQVYPVTAEGYILLPNVGKVRVADLTTGQIEAKLNEVLTPYIREPNVRVGVQEYQSKVIYVVGAVTNAGPVPMKADMLTLQEAYWAAGGATPDASLKRTHIITPDYNHPYVTQVNLNDVIYKGKMKENALLKPNDVVYIPFRYSTNFSSAIKELLVPFNDINDFRFRSNIANNYNGGNSSNNSGKNSGGGGGGIFGF